MVEFSVLGSVAARPCELTIPLHPCHIQRHAIGRYDDGLDVDNRLIIGCMQACIAGLWTKWVLSLIENHPAPTSWVYWVLELHFGVWASFAARGENWREVAKT